MNPQKFQEQILNNAVQMDASVNFQLNGNMLIVPCPWEDEKEVTNGERVRYRGGIEVDADGRTRVKRYNVGKNGPMHETLYETAHGAVKMKRPQYDRGYRRLDKEDIIISFRFVCICGKRSFIKCRNIHYGNNSLNYTRSAEKIPGRPTAYY